MIGKLSQPPKCKTAIDYITAVNKEGKKATLLCHSDGILPTNNQVMAACLEAATKKGDHNLMKPIKHISLDFHEKDKARMTDELMRQIAMEYMEEMGIKDTEFVICRHHDKPYPHCHLVFSRVNRKGKVISNSQDYEKNRRVCKHLTMKYGLYMPKGKETVNRDALREHDQKRMKVMDKVMAARDRSETWKDFEGQLKDRGISMRFHYNNVTHQLMGITFSNGRQSYGGKKLDSSLAYSKLAEKFGEITRMANDQAREFYEDNRKEILRMTSVYRHDDILKALPDWDNWFPKGATLPSLDSLLSDYKDDVSKYVDFDTNDYLKSPDGSECYLPLGMMAAVALAPFNQPMVQCCSGGGGGGSSLNWKNDDDERWKFRFRFSKSIPKKRSQGFKRR